jgi:hypothetical protein
MAKTTSAHWNLTFSGITSKAGKRTTTHLKMRQVGSTGASSEQVPMTAANMLNLDPALSNDLVATSSTLTFPCATIEHADRRWILVGDDKNRILGIRVEERDIQAGFNTPPLRYAAARYTSGSADGATQVTCEGWFPNQVNGNPRFESLREGPQGVLTDGRRPTLKQEVSRIRGALSRNEPVALCPSTVEFANGSPVGAVGVVSAQALSIVGTSIARPAGVTLEPRRILMAST